MLDPVVCIVTTVLRGDKAQWLLYKKICFDIIHLCILYIE